MGMKMGMAGMGMGMEMGMEIGRGVGMGMPGMAWMASRVGWGGGAGKGMAGDCAVHTVKPDNDINVDFLNVVLTMLVD